MIYLGRVQSYSSSLVRYDRALYPSSQYGLVYWTSCALLLFSIYLGQCNVLFSPYVAGLVVGIREYGNSFVVCRVVAGFCSLGSFGGVILE